MNRQPVSIVFLPVPVVVALATSFSASWAGQANEEQDSPGDSLKGFAMYMEHKVTVRGDIEHGRHRTHFPGSRY